MDATVVGSVLTGKRGGKFVLPEDSAWGCAILSSHIVEDAAPFCSSSPERLYPLIFRVFLALKEQGWDLLLLPQARVPSFQHFCTLGRPSPVIWQVLGMRVRTCSLPLFRPAPCQRALSLPGPRWDQSARWDRGLQRSSYPSLQCFPGPSRLQPLSRMGWAVLKEEGDQCSNIQGSHPSLTSGPVQWAWGFSQGTKGRG